METLRAELARAKDQARRSDVAALKAVEELRAEKAAHRRSEDKIAKMAVELKDAVGRYELLEKESQAKAADLKKAMEVAKKPALKLERRRRSFVRTEISRLGSPFCCGRSSEM